MKIPKDSRNVEKNRYRARVGLLDGVRPFVFVALSAVDIASSRGSSSALRDRIVEPFDVIDHAGNFSISMFVGMGVARLTGTVVTKLDASPTVMKTACVAVGTVAVSAANLVAETKWGVGIIHLKTSPDLVDAAYGIGAGVFAATMVDIEPVLTPPDYVHS